MAAFVQLGERIRDFLKSRQDIPFAETRRQNAWFTKDNIERSLSAISQEFLQQDKLSSWLSNYEMKSDSSNVIGVVCAGNLPLVSFHDIMSVLISGHHARIKLSSKDSVLVKWVLNELVKIEPEFKNFFSVVERLKNFDAVIATGSNNSARYFEYYFKSVPHIIRKNRTSVAILDGNESKEDLIHLGHDVFDYFGLGCRNVSKIYLPKSYKLEKFKDHWADFKHIMDHNTYRNNLDYYRTVYLMTNVPMVDIDFVNMVEKKDELHAPIACLYYEFYEDIQEVENFLIEHAEQLQCISSNTKISDSISLGQSQWPGLIDYADGMDVMAFLENV